MFSRHFSVFKIPLFPVISHISQSNGRQFQVSSSPPCLHLLSPDGLASYTPRKQRPLIENSNIPFLHQEIHSCAEESHVLVKGKSPAKKYGSDPLVVVKGSKHHLGERGRVSYYHQQKWNASFPLAKSATGKSLRKGVPHYWIFNSSSAIRYLRTNEAKLEFWHFLTFSYSLAFCIFRFPTFHLFIWHIFTKTFWALFSSLLDRQPHLLVKCQPCSQDGWWRLE